MVYRVHMTNEPELLAELVKANKTLGKMEKYAKFAHNLLQISLALGAVGLVVLALVFVGN